MRILYSAFTAFPSAGSEAQCGWAWAEAMRNYNEVYLLTRKQARKDIEQYMTKNNINNIKVFYHDIPDCINPYYKKGKLYFIYYIMWQSSVKKTIKKLQKQYNFDYVHHITLGDFRVVGTAGKYAKHFIFGPVGGAQLTPKPFKKYIKGHEKSEKIRKLINMSVKINPFYRHKLNKADLVLAANKETQEYLSSMMRNKAKCRLLTENGIFKSKFTPIDTGSLKNNDTIYLLWAGRMIYRKGLEFLLEVISITKSKRDFHLMLVGDGPEKEKLIKKAEELGIEDKVTFAGKVPYTEIKNIYSFCDIFIFPSLRETTGTVLFEAMSNALPVITFNQNGADLLIDESCGIKVNINQSLDDIKKEFACAIEKLVNHSDICTQLGINAYNKIQNEYTWENKCKNFETTFLKDIL